jgi:secondary thiamine-phosphate synthase enzyme
MRKIGVVTSKHSEFLDITSKIAGEVTELSFREGIVLVYSPHTTAGITINEGADPDVQDDILAILDKLIPWNGNYRHAEGNSAAHVKTSLMGPSVNIAVENGRLCLGTWQRIFFCEFDGPRKRNVWLKFYSA